MDTLNSGTLEKPTIHIDSNKGRIEISGRSNLPNSVEFYSELLEKITNCANEVSFTTINVQLTYLNTGSSKWIYHIFRKLESMNKSKGEMQINWYYDEDDETILEAGEDFQALLSIPFNLIELDN
jgi:hypothetical protein